MLDLFHAPGIHIYSSISFYVYTERDTKFAAAASRRKLQACGFEKRHQISGENFPGLKTVVNFVISLSYYNYRRSWLLPHLGWL